MVATRSFWIWFTEHKSDNQTYVFPGDDDIGRMDPRGLLQLRWFGTEVVLVYPKP